MPHHIIFEGADLAGKSWIMSRIYQYLEPLGKKRTSVLDGCRWFNCDNGIFGTASAAPAIAGYLKIFEAVKSGNIIVEKFHWSDRAYKALFARRQPDYRATEKKLLALGFRVVLIKLPPDQAEIGRRLKDRLKLYPHYGRIARRPDWYLKQQAKFERIASESKLDCLTVETKRLPDEKLISAIIDWL